MLRPALIAALMLIPAAALAAAPRAASGPPREGDYVVRDFKFGSGETLPELRLHYLALGKPEKDAKGAVTNAILILHGTGGTGRQFLAPQFADVLYGKGALLDTTRWWVILPDGIGHGHSSKPSDGLHMKFPRYDYDDMVQGHYRLLTEYLGVKHLRLVMGTSMGGMQTWVWGETHPDMMDALMPLACLPVRIAGRNRLWREMAKDAIRNDPEWNGGEYTKQPRAAVRAANDLLILAGGAPIPMQKTTLANADSVAPWLDRTLATRAATTDVNDLLYQLDSSRNYDPSPKLATIQAPVMFVNSADDFINPPELGIAEREILKVPHGRFVLIPASENTHGHGTHTWAAIWKQYLADLLNMTAARNSR